MIKSMTGYGRGSSSSEAGVVTIEIKSVNHRFRDISIKSPHNFSPIDATIKKEIEKRVARGRVDLFVGFTGNEESGDYFDVNIPLARGYLNAMTRLKEELSLDDAPTLSQIAAVKDVISSKELSIDEDALYEIISSSLFDALDSLEGMRAAEGEALAGDIKERLSQISAIAKEISIKQPEITESYRERLRSRIAKLTEGIDLDESRLAQEVALMADRSDITEEIVRLGSHTTQFNELLEGGDAVGRKLDFLVQEMNREANTIGSKSNDVEISRNVVNIKAEIEKIKEQVQNIE